MDIITFKATFPLIIISLVLSIFMITTSDGVNYNNIAVIFVTSLLIAIYEEVIFRGIGLGTFLSSGISPLKAIFLSSIIFSFSHALSITTMGFNIIFLLLNTFIMGFILGYIYYKTKNILLVIVIHFLWDFTVFINEKLPTVKIGTVTTIILFTTTILYFSWSIKKIRQID